MGFIENPIKSVTDYLTRVNIRIQENKGSELIFRGQDRYFEPDEKDKDKDSDIQRFIKSGATRRLEEFYKSLQPQKTDLEIKNDILLDYTVYLLSYSQKKRYHIDGAKKLTYLEMLAELEHFGAATMLIDFSKNALVALYFACKSMSSSNGCVFIINKSKTKEADVKDLEDCMEVVKNPNKLAKYFSKINPNLYHWEPASFNMRIPAQHSIFVFGKPEIKDDNDFIDIICIDKDSKKIILEELYTTYDINDVTLFNDLPGFASANSAESRIENGLYNSEQVGKLMKNIIENELMVISNENVTSKSINDEDKKILAELLFYNGNAHFRLGEYKESITDYSKAISLNINDKYVYYNRGNAYRKLCRYKEAIRDYTTLIGLQPNYAEVYSSRGITYRILKDYKKAIEDFDNAIKLNPNNAVFYFNRGFTYEKLNKNIEAIKDYTKTIELKPNFAYAYNNRAYGYYLLHKIDLAYNDSIKSIRLNPRNPYSRVTLARILQSLNRNDEALKSFNKAFEINSELGLVYYWRGKFFEEIGEKEKAEADFKKAKELGYEPPPNDK